MPKDIGRVFDHTRGHSLPDAATDRLLEHYFPGVPGGELAGREILDAGCRVGDYSLALRRRGARRVVGVDLSGACVERARERAGGDAGLAFRQGDIADLSAFADSSFDVALCLGTMMYLDAGQVRAALAELVRVTRPGGSVLVLFLREQGWCARLATAVANRLPWGLYLPLVEATARALRPLASRFAGRQLDLDILKYDLLWGIQGTHFGVPVAIPERFEVPTASTEACSPKTVVSYRFEVPADKSELDFAARPG